MFRNNVKKLVCNKFIVSFIIGLAMIILPLNVTSVRANAVEVDYNLITEDLMHAFMQGIINGATTPDMTNDQKLKACYEFVLDWMKYSRNPAKPSGDWTKQYALEAFWSGEGNCYRYATAFGYLAKELGYNVRICTGKCSSSKGGWSPHGWTEILGSDGTWKIYDLSFGDSNRGKKNYYGIDASEHARKLMVDDVWELTY